MEVKWFGQSSFKIKSGDKVIYIDPAVGNYDNEEKANIILVTHAHADHFSKEVIDKLSNDNTKIVGNAEVISFVDGKALENNESTEIDGIKINAVPAYNVIKLNHPKGDNNGYVIEIDGKKIYHAGDTDLIPEMNLIEADIVLMPVGGTYTMDADEAAAAVKIIMPDIAIPMHWGEVVGSELDANTFKDEIISETEIDVKIMNVDDTIEL